MWPSVALCGLANKMGWGAEHQRQWVERYDAIDVTILLCDPCLLKKAFPEKPHLTLGSMRMNGCWSGSVMLAWWGSEAKNT